MNSLFDQDEPIDDAKPAGKRAPAVVSIFDQPENPFADAEGQPEKDKEPYILSEAEPLSAAETVRSSGLAWSAAIALFAAVVVMMLIGWGADLLFGSSPWGLVVGIVLGAVIGFLQFFRITGEILKK